MLPLIFSIKNRRAFSHLTVSLSLPLVLSMRTHFAAVSYLSSFPEIQLRDLGLVTAMLYRLYRILRKRAFRKTRKEAVLA